MLKSNLIQLISKLDETEFKKFGKFIDSPYFNVNKKLVEFYKIIADHYPDFNTLELSKENLYRKLYKEDKVVLGTVYYLISEMESLFEKFISIEKIKPFTFEMTFLDELTKLGMHNLFDTKYKEIKKKLLKYPDEMNLNNFILSEINRNNSIQRKEFLTKKDLIKKEWTHPSTQLMILFLKNSLRNILILYNYNDHIGKSLNIPMLKETLEYIQDNKVYNTYIEIKVLYYEIKLLMERDDKYYKELKNILYHCRNKLSFELYNELVVILNNYLLLKKFEGGSFDNEEIFDLSNLYLENISSNKNEKIPVDAFLQIFINGMAVKKFDWLREFVKKYSRKLEEKYQNNAVCYSNAALCFEFGEFDKALKELSGIKQFSYVHFKAVVKKLQLKIYYELNLLSEGMDAAKSYEQFVRNDLIISKPGKTVASDFLRIYFKLLSASHKNTKEKVENLRSEIKNHKRIINSQFWFEDKLDELESRISKKHKTI